MAIDKADVQIIEYQIYHTVGGQSDFWVTPAGSGARPLRAVPLETANQILSILLARGQYSFPPVHVSSGWCEPGAGEKREKQGLSNFQESEVQDSHTQKLECPTHAGMPVQEYRVGIVVGTGKYLISLKCEGSSGFQGVSDLSVEEGLFLKRILEGHETVWFDPDRDIVFAEWSISEKA